LETPEISGIFLLREEGRDEQRLYHTADFRVGQVCSGKGRLAFVVRHKGGGSSIAVMEADGSGFAEVTEGDTIDLAPRWLPDSRHELVFQSAGIGRTEAGVWAGQAPFTVQQLDLEIGAVATLGMAGRGFDLTVLCNELAQRNVLEVVGGAPYIAGLEDDIFALDQTVDYARIVGEHWRRRGIVRAGQAMIERATGKDEVGKCLEVPRRRSSTCPWSARRATWSRSRSRRARRWPESRRWREGRRGRGCRPGSAKLTGCWSSSSRERNARVERR
jgi:hypothetical protein